MPEQLAMDARMQPLLHRRLQELQLLEPEEENNNKRFRLPPITPRESSAESGPSSAVQSSHPETSSRGSRDNASRLSRSDRLSPALKQGSRDKGQGSRDNLSRLSQNGHSSPAMGLTRSKTTLNGLASQSNPSTPAMHRRQFSETLTKNRRAFSPNPKTGLQGLSPDKADFTNFPKSSPKISRHYKSGLDRSRTSLDVIGSEQQQQVRPTPRLTRKQQQSLFERLAKGEKREKGSGEPDGDRYVEEEPVSEPVYEYDVDIRAAIAKCSDWLSDVEEIKQTDSLEPVVAPIIEWDDEEDNSSVNGTMNGSSKPPNVFHVVYEGPQSSS